MKKQKKQRKQKNPSLLRQIIEIHYEQAKRRKAVRQLEKAEWSLDFLSLVIRKAALEMKRDLSIELITAGGHRMILSSLKFAGDKYVADDDIFNKLDDTAAVERFIAEHSVR